LREFAETVRTFALQAFKIEMFGIEMFGDACRQAGSHLKGYLEW
jgi:hypothetical protein